MGSYLSGRGGGTRVLVAAAAVLIGAAPAAAAASTCYTRFGDSLADTGNYHFIFGDDKCTAQRFPYGETFFHHGTGRYSDGRIILDFIADALGLPFVPPYLSGLRAEDLLHGANFAEFFHERGIDFGKVAYLDMEMKWFREMLNLLCPGDLAGWSDMMNQSLFMVGEIGGNDYNKPLLVTGAPFETVVSFTPPVIAKISSAITELIGLGAKTIVVPGNFPIGCLPKYLVAFQGDKEDYEPKTGCIKRLNEFARYHNKLLIEELEKLRKLHPSVTIIYADYYGAAMDIFISPQEHGIKYPFMACCGGGGRYGASLDVTCGRGKYKLCHKPEAYGSWDGIHFPETVYKVIATSLLRGSHTQPPLATTIASSCIKLSKLNLSIDEYKSL